jgi:hypothetical protein
MNAMARLSCRAMIFLSRRRAATSVLADACSGILCMLTSKPSNFVDQRERTPSIKLGNMPLHTILESNLLETIRSWQCI